MKKAKQWVDPCFDDEGASNVSSMKNTLKNKTISKGKNKKISEVAENLLNPIDSQDSLKKFKPKNVEELAVNVKKIQELEHWICDACRVNSPEILLLSGPVGCGKTISVQLIAKKYKIKLTEWITPVDIDLTNDRGDVEYREKQSTRFLEFLLKAANFASLLSGPDESSKIVLVEDIPNIFFRNSDEFSEVLQQYSSRARSPLIFICSDSHNDTACSPLALFSNNIREKFRIHQISFNSVSTTNLRTALKRVAEEMKSMYFTTYDTPSAETIDCVVNSSAGDIRSAVLNLHFASLKGIFKMPLEYMEAQVSSASKSVTKKGVRKKSVKSSKFLSMGKDEAISILHGVGRVLNPKENDSGKLVHSPCDVMEQFMTQPTSFVNFIQENYLPHFSTINETEKAARCLSDADYMLAEWREKFSKMYGLYVAVTGLMVSNKNPVPGWNPVRGPKSMRVTYPSAAELKLEEDQLYNGRVLVEDYKTYCSIINNYRYF